MISASAARFVGHYAPISWWVFKNGLYSSLLEHPQTVSSYSDIGTFMNSMQGSAIVKIQDASQIMETNQDPAGANIVIGQINPANDPEKYLKTVYSFYYMRFIDNTFPKQTDLDNLIFIASLCPLEDGPAVIIARNLLMAYDDKQYISSCEDGYGYRIAKNDTTKKYSIANNIKTSFSLYPNPNDGLMDLTYCVPTGSNAVINIFTVTGMNSLNRTIPIGTGILNINARDLSEGLYLYEILVDAKLIEHGKLVIIKQ